MSRTAWYKLERDTEEVHPRLEAASEKDALRSFAREMHLKLDFAEDNESSDLLLTNTSTGETWWVVTSQ